MRTDLLRPVDRRLSASHKWDTLKSRYGTEDIIPMGVADLDFAAPDFVLAAIAARAAHPAYSYSIVTGEDRAAVLSWLSRRRGVRVEDGQLRFTPGVIASLYNAVRALTRPGEAVALQSPIYGPFFTSVQSSGRRVVDIPMARGASGGYSMDYGGIEDAFKAGVKLFLLCNPHNPVGRVWTRTELETLYGLAEKYGVVVLADEIHADIALAGHPLTCALAVRGAAERTIMASSASKSFNLAGLVHAYTVIPNPGLAARFDEELARSGMNHLNVFGPVATTAAYSHGDAWLDALNGAIDANRNRVERALREGLGGVNAAKLEGTYLMWLDVSALGISDDDAESAFARAGVGIQPGLNFGQSGAGYVRMNIGCPAPQLETALERIRKMISR